MKNILMAIMLVGLLAGCDDHYYGKVPSQRADGMAWQAVTFGSVDDAVDFLNALSDEQAKEAKITRDHGVFTIFILGSKVTKGMFK